MLDNSIYIIALNKPKYYNIVIILLTDILY